MRTKRPRAAVGTGGQQCSGSARSGGSELPDDHGFPGVAQRDVDLAQKRTELGRTGTARKGSVRSVDHGPGPAAHPAGLPAVRRASVASQGWSVADGRNGPGTAELARSEPPRSAHV